jgi:hypothetical protein
MKIAVLNKNEALGREQNRPALCITLLHGNQIWPRNLSFRLTLLQHVPSHYHCASHVRCASALALMENISVKWGFCLFIYLYLIFQLVS